MTLASSGLNVEYFSLSSFFFPYTKERVPLETAVDVLWFRMDLHFHIKVSVRSIDLRKNQSHLSSLSVYYSSVHLSVCLSGHISGYQRAFPPSLIEIILNFSFARCLSFSRRPRWSSRCNALGCDNLCWGSRFSSLLGQAATFPSSPCGKSHYDGFKIMMEKLISGRRDHKHRRTHNTDRTCRRLGPRWKIIHPADLVLLIWLMTDPFMWAKTNENIRHFRLNSHSLFCVTEERTLACKAKRFVPYIFHNAAVVFGKLIRSSPYCQLITH